VKKAAKTVKKGVKKAAKTVGKAAKATLKKAQDLTNRLAKGALNELNKQLTKVVDGLKPKLAALVKGTLKQFPGLDISKLWNDLKSKVNREITKFKQNFSSLSKLKSFVGGEELGESQLMELELKLDPKKFIDGLKKKALEKLKKFGAYLWTQIKKVAERLLKLLMKPLESLTKLLENLKGLAKNAAAFVSNLLKQLALKLLEKMYGSEAKNYLDFVIWQTKMYRCGKMNQPGEQQHANFDTVASGNRRFRLAMSYQVSVWNQIDQSRCSKNGWCQGSTSCTPKQMKARAPLTCPGALVTELNHFNCAFMYPPQQCQPMKAEDAKKGVGLCRLARVLATLIGKVCMICRVPNYLASFLLVTNNKWLTRLVEKIAGMKLNKLLVHDSCRTTQSS